MLTCKQVATSLNDRDYAELSPLKRLFLKLHVRLCIVCGRYHRHVMRFQDGVRRYRKGEASRTSAVPGQLALQEREREAIRRALNRDTNQPDVDRRA